MKRTSAAIVAALTLTLGACSSGTTNTSAENTATQSSTSSADTSSSSSVDATESPKEGEEDQTAGNGSTGSRPQPTPPGEATPTPTPDIPGAPVQPDTPLMPPPTFDGNGNMEAVEGGPCAKSQISYPGVTADGNHVVCIMDPNNPHQGIWVDGPAPSGETRAQGDPCVEGPNGDSGAVDNRGRIMICSGGQWVYGP